MARKEVRYYFAFASPFAALADSRIDDLVAEAGAVLVPIPLVPPPTTSTPTGIAAQLQEWKFQYMYEDTERWARKLGLAWKPPQAARVDTTDATAGWYFAREKGKERPYRRAVFVARWSEGRDISDREVLTRCAEKAGLDAKEFLEALGTGRYHEEVPKAFELAAQDRVFGVPLFVVDGKRFWGNDRIDFLLEELRG
ncbi:MAG: 2-hydroxychromene-2-carboxylate isomerase [Candidatus Binatia bacterium]|nr:MAG: 2-hydroxychromene-2-carboxylate isomerase [Candidatus Binatia bacterium]